METAPSVIRNRIGGEWLPASDGAVQQQRDPANLARFHCVLPRSPRRDAARAIEAAGEAFRGWSRRTPAQRAGLLDGALAAMRQRRDEIAGIICRENGKTLREAHAEVEAGIAEMAWQLAEGVRMDGAMVPSARERTMSCVVRRPLGVVSAILPFNFPFNVPIRKCIPALMAGNTVVMKPSSLTPRSAAWLVERLVDAGLPPGVINSVTGDGDSVGDECVRHPSIRAVSFTGSTAVGLGIQRAAAQTLARTQLEMGGKNAAVVLADADLPRAADAVIAAAFACAGQWCTSTSRVIVERSIALPFERAMRERVARIRLGPGLDPDSTMGPVCGEGRLQAVLGHIGDAIEDGARLLCGGSRHGSEGCFVAPTVFTDVSPSMRVAREEVFGPVLAMMVADGYEDMISMVNDVPFGLSASIFTKSLDRAFAFLDDAEVGLAHVNLSTAYREPNLPFGGIKLSGSGVPEAGRSGLDFFTRHQAIYLNAADG